MSKTRLDQRVFDLGLAESREKAKALIMSGIVYVNGQKEDKAGTAFPEAVGLAYTSTCRPSAKVGTRDSVSIA